METARAVWFEGPRSVALRDEWIGSPGEGEVRVETVLSAISHGTEMLVYRGLAPPEASLDLPTLVGSFGFPIKYGYAAVGRVAEVGPSVLGLTPGDLVYSLHPHQDRFVAPVELVKRLPGELDVFRAIFFANVETALNALLDHPIRLGEHVVVMGQGVVGLLIGMLARRNGASRVIVVDALERRRSMGLSLGAHAALAPDDDLVEATRAATGGSGADVVFEASGNPAALQSAIDVVADEATVVVCSWYGTKQANVGLGGRFHRGRIKLRSSQVGRIDPGLEPRWDRDRRTAMVIELLQLLPLDELVTHRFPFQRASEAYRLIDERPEETVQVVLTYE